MSQKKQGLSLQEPWKYKYLRKLLRTLGSLQIFAQIKAKIQLEIRSEPDCQLNFRLYLRKSERAQKFLQIFAQIKALIQAAQIKAKIQSEIRLRSYMN